MELLKLLSEMSSLGPLIAVQSLSTFELPYSNEEGGQVRDVPGKHGNRELIWPGSTEPVIEAVTSGDGIVTWWLQKPEQPPNDLCLALAAIGSKPRQSGHRIELGSLDADAFDERVRACDVVWSLIRRLKAQHESTQQDKLLADSERLIKFALAWSRNRGRLFELDQSGASVPSHLTKERDRLEAEASSLVSGGIAGLQSIKLHQDPRGSACALKFADSNHVFELAGVAIDYPVVRLRLEYAKEIRIGEGKHAVRPTKLSDEVLGVLHAADIRGSELRLTGQLPKRLYAKVDEILREIGGQWHIGKQAHVFDAPCKPIVEEMLARGVIFTRKDFEFFPTPLQLVERMISLVNLAPGMRVLEPNAGDGAIACEAAKIVGPDLVQCYELMPANVQTLRALGFQLDRPMDFLQTTPSPVYHVVLANPPFSMGRDIAHIQHAMKFLKPGGTLCAIASTSWQHSTNRRSEVFRNFIRQHNGTVYQVEPGAFKESGTDIATTMLLLHAPMVAAPVSRISRARDGDSAQPVPVDHQHAIKANELSQFSLF